MEQKPLSQSDIEDKLKLNFEGPLADPCLFIEKGEYSSENLRKLIQASKKEYNCSVQYGRASYFTDAFGDGMRTVYGYFLCRKR